jgi:hypothetical protein
MSTYQLIPQPKDSSICVSQTIKLNRPYTCQKLHLTRPMWPQHQIYHDPLCLPHRCADETIVHYASAQRNQRFEKGSREAICRGVERERAQFWVLGGVSSSVDHQSFAVRTRRRVDNSLFVPWCRSPQPATLRT